MNTLTRERRDVNLCIYDPNPEPDETLETSEWIKAQAAYYRSLGSDLADLVAETLDELARTWRVVSGGEPISVDTFKGRCDVMEELHVELAPDREYL